MNQVTHSKLPTADALKATVLKLLVYCQREDWAGYDPYDALNSRLLNKTPFVASRVFRIGVTQLLKRLPINLRPLLLIRKEQNAKALALFLMAFVRLEKIGLLPDKSLIPLMVERLIALRSPASSTTQNGATPRTDPIDSRNPSNPYWCWGYSFPWQTRTILVPKAYPNLVCTTFVANALLDLYESLQSDSLASGHIGDVPAASREAALDTSGILGMAVSAAEYVLDELYWSEGGACGFSYPLPALNNRVHNANFLGAALLSRVYRLTGQQKFLDPALRAARYSAERQHDDGSWDYGENSTQRWIDNFHTGYNLCALRAISKYAGTSDFELNISRGFRFYLDHFFTADGVPKYFHNRIYPIDIHSVAQSIITLLTFAGLEPSSLLLTSSVIDYATRRMWNDGGYFYYQAFSLFTNRLSYMRWSQAWMIFSIASAIESDVHV